MRVGLGFDAHRFSPERALVLGGVEVPFDKGLLGHSDADALLHAIIDALLGAAALGDIGTHFPPTDPAYKDASSLKLLMAAVELIRGAGFSVVNVDSTILTESPLLKPYIEKMRENIAAAIGVDVARVSVKATTTEGMGFTGSGEGLSAYAVALLE